MHKIIVDLYEFNGLGLHFYIVDKECQSANGPGRPTCEVDPHLILAHGPKRFDPNQKRDGRVEIRSIPIDPRVDPDGTSPPPATAPPLLLPHEDSAPPAVTGGGGAACRRPAAGGQGAAARAGSRGAARP